MKDQIMNEILKRPRGRPRLYNTDLDKIIRTRGRPKGAKNKPKTILSDDSIVDMNTNGSMIEGEGGIGTKEGGLGDVDISLQKISKNFSKSDLPNDHPTNNNNTNNSSLEVTDNEAFNKSDNIHNHNDSIDEYNELEKKVKSKITPELVIAA